jgi:hypothetical protein
MENYDSIQVYNLGKEEIASFHWDGEQIRMIMDTPDPLEASLIKKIYDEPEWFNPETESIEHDKALDNFKNFLTKICPLLVKYCYTYKLS